MSRQNVDIVRAILEAFNRGDMQLEAWEEVPLMEAEEIIDAGDQVVAFVRVHGRGKGSGAAVDARIAQVWTIRGGKATQLEYLRGSGQGFELRWT